MMMFILTSIAVDLILSSTILLILVPSSTVLVQGWNTNNSNNNQFSLRSSSLFSGATTVWNRNRNNSKGIGNVIGINNNNRNHNKNSNRNRNNSRHRNNNNAATVSLSLVPLDFVDFSSHFSTAISTKYEATKTALAQPLLTEAKSAIPLVKEAAKKVAIGAAETVQQVGGASTSSDVQAEILTDSSIGLMEYPSFLPDVKTSQLRIKYAQVLGRILIIDISLLPGHSFHPEELAIQLFLLGASMDPIIRSIQLFRAISAVRCTTEGCTIDFDDLVDDNKDNNTGVGIGIGGGGREVECTFINNNATHNKNDPDLACLDYNNSNNIGGNDNNNENGIEGTLIIENYEEDESFYL